MYWKSSVTLLSVVIFSLLYSCGGVKIKPQPPGEGWHLCTVCRGKGFTEVRSSGGSYEDEDLNDNTNETLSFCLLPLLSENTRNEKDEKHFETGEPYSLPLEKRDYKRLKEENAPSGRSMVSRKVRCPRCEGTGWINFLKEKDPDNYDKAKYDELKHIMNKKQ